ncbi:MAG: alpha/beta hydrolase [Gammaproteobacteria bacterium]|nr:alpha/beta hydrolase [Gammaproteobacteria bacterium]
MKWIDEMPGANGARRFEVAREGNAIPAALWGDIETAQRRPLILLGHGGSGHKLNSRMCELGAMYADEYDCIAVAIDGPVHGDRGPVSDANHPAYAQMWAQANPVQGMIADWAAVIDALMALPQVDPARIGYWGVSMGTMFGLPMVACEPRVRVAVLGKAGMSGSSVARSGIDTYFREYAQRVTIPVLFSIQWDDERFERDGQLELFDRLGAENKRLHAYPGKHVDNGPEAFRVQAEFLMSYLQ